MGDLSEFNNEVPLTVQKIYEFHEKMNATEKGPHRGRLGASVIGEKCERKLWYMFRGLIEPKFDGRILRLFETGHLEEPRFVRELRGIGCEVHDLAENGKQFEYTALGGHFVCHPDGFVLGLPESPETWHVTEFKTMGGEENQSKDFEKVKLNGVEKAIPKHYAQMQVEMGLTGLKRAIYMCKKKATDHIHAERVRYNDKEYKLLMEKAERIITANKPPERYASRSDSFDCKFCGAKELCWGLSEIAVPICGKTCRSCCHATPVIDDENAQWSCSSKEAHDNMWWEEIVSTGNRKACDAHLLLPFLVSFADPIDAGEDWIEFQNKEDNAIWRHGVGEGAWTTEELISGPGPLNGAKECLADKVPFEIPELNLVEKFDPVCSKLVWNGSESNLLIGMKKADIKFESVPSEEFEDERHKAYRYNQDYLVVVYKGYDMVAIWKGME